MNVLPCMYVCGPCVSGALQQAEEGIRFSGTGVVNFPVVVGNRTLGLSASTANVFSP